MAILSGGDYGEILYLLYRKGQGKEELKALATLPSKSQYLAAFQAIENVFEANRAAMKSGIDAALGVTTSAPLARKIFAAWLVWKASK